MSVHGRPLVCRDLGARSWRPSVEALRRSSFRPALLLERETITPDDFPALMPAWQGVALQTVA
jgi:hypothetical protein